MRLQLKNRLSPKAALRSRGGELSRRVLEYDSAGWQLAHARARGALFSDVTHRTRGFAQCLPRPRAQSRASRPQSSKHHHELPMIILYRKPHSRTATTPLNKTKTYDLAVFKSTWPVTTWLAVTRVDSFTLFYITALYIICHKYFSRSTFTSEKGL